MNRMRELHSVERQQFEKLFKQEKIDRFDDRFKVLEAFLNKERHMTASDLAGVLKDQKVSLPEAFIEETLELMCYFGFAQKNRFKNGDIHYEHRHLGQHHDHLICTKCGDISEFKNDRLEQLQGQVSSQLGFHMLQHRMDIYGICGNCLKARDQQMPLTAAKQGERVVIRDFLGGGDFKLRLLSMGLRVGDELEVITNHGKGRLVIAADYQRYVLGPGMAQKIIVAQMAAAD